MEKAAVQLEGEKSLFQMFWHLSFVFILKIRFTSLLRGKVLVMLYFHIVSKPHEKQWNNNLLVRLAILSDFPALSVALNSKLFFTEDVNL